MHIAIRNPEERDCNRSQRVSSLLIFLLLLGWTSSLAAQEHRPPNIVLIICDDLNDSLQGMGGHPQARTPHLARLMKQGVRFSHAYANVPLCGPSRASLLTGLYPHTTGYYSNKNNWKRMRHCPKLKDAVTFMEHFWNHGYDVYGTGKINHNLDAEPHVWKKQDGTPTYGGNMNWGPWPSNGNGREGFRGPVHPSLPATVHVDNMFASLADVPSFAADPANNVPGYSGWMLEGKPFRYKSESDRDLMPDELSAQYAVNVLKKKHEKPFLLCVGINRPHTPLIAPQKYFDLFPLDSLVLATTKIGDNLDCADVLTRSPDVCTGKHGLHNFNGIVKGGGQRLLKEWLQAYLACVAFADDQVGKILDANAVGPGRDNTYIVFVSDHGYHFGEKDTLFKMTLWEEAGRIPFFVAGPGIPKAGICGRPISLIDLYPTMIDLCGLPESPNRKTNRLPLDGHSLKPLLVAPQQGRWAGPKVALTEIANADQDPKPQDIHPSRHHFAVRSRRFRYLLCNNGEEELYDHDSDPYEWKNVANDREFSTKKQALRQQLLVLTGQTNQPLLDQIPQ